MEDTLELVINNNESVNEFLERLLTEKAAINENIIGNINGFQFSTNDCNTIEELRNKVAHDLGVYIKANKEVANNTIPRRLYDDFTRIFDTTIDEEISANNIISVDFDDPSNVYEWIVTSAYMLNNPQFARLTLKDGKTAAEKIVEILEEKGYGHPSQADDPMTQAINEKMNDLREYGYLVNDLFENQPIINPKPIKEEPVINNTNFQEVPKDSEFKQHSFFQKLPKSNEKSTFQTMSKEKEDSIFENKSNQQQESTGNSLDRIETIRQQFNIPSENINENKSAIMVAIGSGDAHDIEVAKVALQAIPDSDPEKASLASELQKIIDMQSPVNNTIDYDKEIQSIEDNIYEIKKEMARLLEREKKNVARIEECGEILKQPKPNLITQLNNINYQNNFEESKKRIQRQNEYFSKEIVENKAMPFYNKAIETHAKEDIIEAFVQAERLLESGHLYREPIQSAMRAMVPVYYPGQTLDDLLNEKRAQQRFEDGKKHIEGLNNFYDKSLADKAMPFYNRALETKTKEDILKALEESEKLENNNGGYKEAIRNTLEGMVPVYYPGQTLNDLINEKEANNHLEKEIQHIKTLNNFYDKSLADKAMPFYNKAMETHDKEDIIKAVAAAERNLSFGNPYIGAIQNAMQALVAVYYPGKTLDDLMNEKRQEQRAKESEEQVQRYKSILGEDEITNTAISFYDKALETKDVNDVVTALQEINRLSDNNLMKQPMLDALNYNLNINQETSTGPKKEEIKEEFDQLIAENNEIHNKIMELREKELKLGEEKNRLQEEQERLAQENNNPPADNPESDTSQDNPENEEENEEDLSQGDNGSDNQGEEPTEEKDEIEEEAPMKVVSDEVNQNLGLWKKAILGIDKALEKLKLGVTGKVVVLGVTTVLFSIYTAAVVGGAYLFIRHKAKKYKKKLEEQQNTDDEEYEDEYEEEEVEEQENTNEEENTHQEEELNQDEFIDLTNKIIQEGMKAVTPRVQYYRSTEEDKWNTINSENQEQEKNEIFDAISNGENIGYKIVEGNNEQTPEVQLIDDDLLINYIKNHQAELPTVDEIASVSAENQMSPLQNQEEMGRGM